VTVQERLKALSPRERNLLGAALAVAVLVVVRFGLMSDEEEFESGSVEAPWVQVAKIENYRRILSRAGAVEKQTEEIDARFRAQQERLTSGATPTQVAAELQGSLSSMAADSGLNVLSSQILKEEEVDGSRRVGVRLTLSGELGGIAKLVAAVEGGQKDLVIAHLEVNRKLGSSRRPPTPRAQPEPTTQPPLTVSLEVKTFMRQET
jgi:type II secretory pathway component PulM